jgi:hypothetical protein
MADELNYREFNVYPEYQAQDRKKNQASCIRPENNYTEKSHADHFKADVHLP